MSLTKAEQIAQAVAAESEKPRIGKITFYGLCFVCGDFVDVTSKLDFIQKKYMVDTYGVEKRGDKWVCKEEIPLPNCPKCLKSLI